MNITLASWNQVPTDAERASSVDDQVYNSWTHSVISFIPHLFASITPFYQQKYIFGPVLRTAVYRQAGYKSPPDLKHHMMNRFFLPCFIVTYC